MIIRMLEENRLRREAFETYDAIVDWCLKNHREVIEEVEKSHMNIDWSERMLRGCVREMEEITNNIISNKKERPDQDKYYRDYVMRTSYNTVTGRDFDRIQYCIDLEKYCDMLENTIGGFQNVMKDYERLEKTFDTATRVSDKYIEKLEEALDKACDYTAFFQEKLLETLPGSYKPRNKEQWKEWALQDDK